MKAAKKSKALAKPKVRRTWSLADRLEEILLEQRRTLEILALHFDKVNGGEISNESANVGACITTMLGHFSALDDTIGIVRSDENDEKRGAA